MLRLCAVLATLAGLALPASAAAALSITPSTMSVVDGTTVTFNATPDAGATLTWAFDDGTSATGTSATHTFTGVGTHVVTVTESGAATGSATITVTVTAAYPTALPTGPPPGFELPIFGAGARPRRMPANRAAIVASCMFATGACHGTIVLRSAKPVRDRPGRKARVVTLGRKDFTLAPSTKAAIAVTVPRKMRTLVSKLRRVGATAVAAVHDDAGHTATDSVSLTLTAAR